MKRNMDLVTLILKYVAENADDINPIPLPFEELSKFGGESIIRGHVRLCEDQGYLELDRSTDQPQILRLTWDGHEKIF